MALNASGLRRLAGPLVDYFNEQFEALKGEMRTQSELQSAHFDQVQEAANTRLYEVIVDGDTKNVAKVAELELKVETLRATVDTLTAEIAELQHGVLQLQTVTAQLLALQAASSTTS